MTTLATTTARIAEAAAPLDGRLPVAPLLERVRAETEPFPDRTAESPWNNQHIPTKGPL